MRRSLNSGITFVPALIRRAKSLPARWLIDPDQAFDPRIGLTDHVYSTRGGFVPRDRFDPGDLMIDGIPAAGLDPVFQLALHVGQAAWRDAKTDRIDCRRAGVIFGNIVLPVESVACWSREVLATGFEEQLGLEPKPPRAVEPLNVFPAGLPAAYGRARPGFDRAGLHA